QRSGDLVTQPLDEGNQSRSRRHAVEAQVELLAERQLLVVVFRGLHRIEKLLQVVQIGLRQQPDGQSNGVALEDGTQVVDLLDLVSVETGNREAAMRLRRHQSLVLEH